MKQLTFNGKSSGSFGVWISAGGTFDAPARAVTPLTIPGRNGTLLLDNGRFNNVPITYPAFIPFGLKDKVGALRAWLCAAKGYARLSDDYDPSHYRLAYFAGGITFTTTFLAAGANFDLAFNAKPQRFLVSGDTPQIFAAPGTILNPTLYDAKPLITVTGTAAGSITIGGVKVQILAIDNTLTLDCDTEDAYRGATNCNADVLADDFPSLPAGESAVSFDGGITAVSITPRWWTV